MFEKMQKLFRVPQEFFVRADLGWLNRTALASFFVTAITISSINYWLVGGGKQDSLPHFLIKASQQSFSCLLILFVYCVISSLIWWGVARLVKRPLALQKIMVVYGVTISLLPLMSLAVVLVNRSNEGCLFVYVLGGLIYGWITGSGVVAMAGGTQLQTMLLSIPNSLFSFLIFMALFAPAYCGLPSPKAPNELVGKSAPDFSSTLTQGSNFKLSEVRGKVVMLDFWATWCPACCWGLPHIQDLADRYRAQGLETCALTTESKDKVVRFAESKKIHIPLAVCQSETDDAFHVNAVPLTVLIDREGKIAAVYLGYNELDKLEESIQKLLAQPCHQ